jgi:hypothetical protein
MRGWLKREIADIDRAKELRVKEASGLVEAYALGEISQDELQQRMYEYSCRWGEPLPGVPRSEGLSDEQILARINQTRVLQGELEPDFLKRRRPRSNIPRR